MMSGILPVVPGLPDPGIAPSQGVAELLAPVVSPLGRPNPVTGVPKTKVKGRRTGSAGRRAVWSIPNDPGLPTLGQLLPAAGPPHFVVELAQEVTGLAADQFTANASYVRYKPTKDCVAQWKFAVPSGPPIIISARLFKDDRAAAIVASSAFQRLARSTANAGTPSYRYLPEERVLLQVAPLDIKLPGLPVVISGDWARTTFASVLGLRRGEIEADEPVLVSYKAWHRAVVRHTVASEGRRFSYFAKVFRDDRGEILMARQKSLKAEVEATGGFWDVPSPVLYAPAIRTLVYEALEGVEDIRSLLIDAAEDPAARIALRRYVIAAAEGLPCLQRLAVDGLDTFPPTEILRWTAGKLKGLHLVDPAIAQAAEQRLSALQEEANRLPAEPLVVAHGAFRHLQMLGRGDRLGVIDFDELRLAGQSADAGEFLSCLDRTAVRRPGLKPVVEEMAEVFLSVLDRQDGFDPRWIAWYRAAANLKNALRAFVDLSPRSDTSADGFMTLVAGGAPE
jgi:hypothetical protein